MIKIELFNQETKNTETFTEVFVSARQLRQVMKFGAKAETEDMSELEQLDELIAIVADLFRSDKVTFDSILDGVASDKLNDTLSDIMSAVMGGEEEKKGLKEKALKAQGAVKA